MGGVAALQIGLSPLGAEGAGGGLPGAVVKVLGGPAGAVLRARGRVGVVVQVLPHHIAGEQGGLGLKVQGEEVKVNVRAVGPALMELHGNGVLAVHQQIQRLARQADAAGLGLGGVGAAVLQVLRDALVIKAGDPGPVQVYGGRVVIEQAAHDLLHGRGVGNRDGGAEEVGLLVVAVLLVLFQKRTDGIASIHALGAAVLGAEAAGGSLPGAVVKVRLRPLGAARQAGGRIRPVVQIAPHRIPVNLGRRGVHTDHLGHVLQHGTAPAAHGPDVREVPADVLVRALLLQLIGGLVLAVLVVGRAVVHTLAVDGDVRTGQVVLIGGAFVHAVVAAADAGQIVISLEGAGKGHVSNHPGPAVGIAADKAHVVVPGDIVAGRIAVLHSGGAVVVKGRDAARLIVRLQIAHEVAVADGVVVLRHQTAVAVPAGNRAQGIALFDNAVVPLAQGGAPAVVGGVGPLHVHVGQPQLSDGAVVLKDKGRRSVHAGDRQAGDGVAVAVQGAVEGGNGLKLTGQLDVRGHVEVGVGMLPNQVQVLGRADFKNLAGVGLIMDLILGQAHHIAAAGADLGFQLVGAGDLLHLPANLGRGGHAVVIDVRVPVAFSQEVQVEGHLPAAVGGVLHRQIPLVAAAAQEGGRLADFRLVQHNGLVPHGGQNLDKVGVDLVDHILGVLAELEIAGGHDNRVGQHVGPAGRAQLAAVGKVHGGVVRAPGQQAGKGQDRVLVGVALILHAPDRLAGHLVGIGAGEAGRLHGVVVADHNLIFGGQPGEIFIEAHLVGGLAVDVVDLHPDHAGFLAALEEVPGILLGIQAAVIAGGRRILPQPDFDRIFQCRAVIDDFLDRGKLLVQGAAEVVPALNQVELDAELGGVVAVLLIARDGGGTAALGCPHGAARLNPAGIAGKQLLVHGVGHIGDHIAVGKVVEVVGNNRQAPGGIFPGDKRLAVVIPILGLQHAAALGAQPHPGPVIDVGLGDAHIGGLVRQLEGGQGAQQTSHADARHGRGLGGHLHILDALVVGAVAVLIKGGGICWQGKAGVIPRNRVFSLGQVILDGNSVVIRPHVQGHGGPAACHREGGLVVMVAGLGVHAPGLVGLVQRGLNRPAQNSVLPQLHTVRRQAQCGPLQHGCAVQGHGVAQLSLSVHIDGGHQFAVGALHLVADLVGLLLGDRLPATAQSRTAQVLVHDPDSLKIPADALIGLLLSELLGGLVRALQIVGRAVGNRGTIDRHVAAGQVICKGSVTVVAAADAGVVPIVDRAQRAAAENHVALIYGAGVAIAADDAAVVRLGGDVTLHIAVEHLGGILAPGSDAAALAPAGHITDKIAILNRVIVLRHNAAGAVSAGDRACHITLLNRTMVLEAQARSPAGFRRIGAGDLHVSQGQRPDCTTVFPHQGVCFPVAGQRVAVDGVAGAVQRAGKTFNGGDALAVKGDVRIQLVICLSGLASPVDGLDGLDKLAGVRDQIGFLLGAETVQLQSRRGCAGLLLLRRNGGIGRRKQLEQHEHGQTGGSEPFKRMFHTFLLTFYHF